MSLSEAYWMVTVAVNNGLVYTIAINESPATWLFKWGCHNDGKNRREIVFAMPISKDEYEALNSVRS